MIANTDINRAYAAVSAEVVEPWPDRPTEGFFHFNVEFSPMANPSWEAGRFVKEQREYKNRVNGNEMDMVREDRENTKGEARKWRGNEKWTPSYHGHHFRG